MAAKPNTPNTAAPAAPAPVAGTVVRVAVVEDDPLLRETIMAFLQRANGFSCVGGYLDAETALAQIPCVKPDVVLMDIGLPGMSGIECARALKNLLPGTPIVMLTVYDEGDYLFASLQAGASGYLLKRTPGPRLLEAVREACQGGLPLTRQMAVKVQNYFLQLGRHQAEVNALAPREKETLQRLAEGLRYKEIATLMGISLDTVRQNVRSIYAKLHVNSRTEAVVKYLRR
jgi:DNA-binding NarL/FixJ family response regulator